MIDAPAISLTVNGTARTVDARPGMRLLDLLRDGLGLTGTKEGCEDGTCGTCTVLVDGRMVRACRVAAVEAAGSDVVTIEGLGTPEAPHPIQRAFAEADAVQCGFCTPGMVMAAAALLERDPHPSRERIARWLGSNLCRCTGYQSILDAVECAADGCEGPARRSFATSIVPSGARRAEALEKATGRAVYAADLAVPGMLHGRVLRSPHAHADIVRLDAERARALPGVVAVLTAADVPENSYGRRVKDQPVLAASRVRQLGDPIALVVAESAETAAAALAAVEVEYHRLPVVRTADEALTDGAPAIHPGGNLVAEHRVTVGDVAEAFARADVVVERTYETPLNEHAYLEPEATLAYPDGETLVVRTPTQYSHYQRAEIARSLGLPTERVRVVPTVVGGAFGGKTEISGQILAALAAWRTGRPVRIVYGREESFASTGKRHPFRIRCRAGATRDGDLLALEVDMLADTGGYSSFGPGLMVKSFGSAAGPYRWPAVALRGRVVFTNNPNAGCMRGPGTTQSAFALEAHLDALAEALGIDPLRLRDRNRLLAGDHLLSGQLLDRDPGLGLTIDAVRREYEAALARCSEANAAATGSVRRGAGVASIWYGIGGGGGGPVPGWDPALTVGRSPGRAAIDLLPDGTARVRTGVADLGQGSTPAMRLIAAEELGVPAELVRAETGDTGTCPDAGAAVGSRVTYLVGNAVRDAARQARAAIAQAGGVAAAAPATFDGVYDPVLPPFDPAAGVGEPYAMFVTGTHVAEVEVDTESGDIRVLRIVAAHDVGRPVFPEGLVGQIEGGIAMGVGFALTEEFVPGETHGFREYRIPRTRDVPEMVTLLVGDPDEPPELRAKGVAECANMPVAPAIVNAVAHATGHRPTRLPIRLAPDRHPVG